MKQWAKKQTGFTIVELLIVVVVIAILAAITIVAYNGISERARQSAVQSSTSQAVRKVELYKTSSDTNSYPATASQAGISTISGLAYFAQPADGTYCVEARDGTTVYSATNTSTEPAARSCIESGLRGWWRMNGNGDDSSGNGLPASLSGTSAVGQNGQADGAYDFNGVPPTATVANAEDILTPYNTFSFWYNADTWNTGAATSFVAKRNGTSTGHFIMRLTSSNSLSIDCGGSGNRWTPNFVLPLNQWAHVVVTCSPTQVAAYVNNALVGTAARTAGSLANSTVLQFGRDGAGYGLDGRMDDIRLFNRVLTPEEVQALYNEGAQ